MILRKKNEVMNILERLDYLPEKIRYLISLTLDFLVFLLSLYISLKIYKLEFNKPSGYSSHIVIGLKISRINSNSGSSPNM